MKNNFSTYKFQNERNELEIYRHLELFGSSRAQTICKLNFHKREEGSEKFLDFALRSHAPLRLRQFQ